MRGIIAKFALCIEPKVVNMVREKSVFVMGEAVDSVKRCCVAAAIARMLGSVNDRVKVLRCDSSLNTDYALVDECKHGECFVTEEGDEVPCECGVCERITGHAALNVSAGRVLQNILNNERRGNYNGRRLMLDECFADEARLCAERCDCDRLVVDVDGEMTSHFAELAKMMQDDGSAVIVLIGNEECPTDGLTPDVLIEAAMLEDVSIYDIPELLDRERIYHKVGSLLGMKERGCDAEWKVFAEKLRCADEDIMIGVVGDYAESENRYLSVKESLKIAGVHAGARVVVKEVCVEHLNHGDIDASLEGCDAVVIAPGRGAKGMEGRIAVACRCRENDVPMLAIGSGMHAMVTEVARNVAGLEGANPTTVDVLTPHAVIVMRDGLMMPGACESVVARDTLMHKVYNTTTVMERHREAMGVNPAYKEVLARCGLMCSMTHGTGHNEMVDAVEMRGKRWMAGVLFHPEYNGTATTPNKVMTSVVRAAMEKKKEK